MQLSPMRFPFLALVLAVSTGPSFAQTDIRSDAQTAPQTSAAIQPRLGEYRLGMTAQETRTRDATADWHDQIDDNGTGFRNGTMSFVDAEAAAFLEFKNNALFHARLFSRVTTHSWADCLTALVNGADEVEATAAPLSGVARNGEGFGRAGSPAATSTGSQIRTYGNIRSGPAIAIAESVDHHTRVTAGWRNFGGNSQLCYVRAEIGAAAPDDAGSVLANETGDDPPAGLFWQRRPNPNDIYRFYPPLAESLDLGGAAELTCTVQSDNHIDCHTRAEQPIGWNFGDAAVVLSRLYEVAPNAADGSPSAGRTFHLRVRFQP